MPRIVHGSVMHVGVHFVLVVLVPFPNPTVFLMDPNPTGFFSEEHPNPTDFSKKTQIPLICVQNGVIS
jgi:hypothetical protein